MAGRLATALRVLFGQPAKGMTSVTDQGSWRLVWDTVPGAWQQDVQVDQASVLTFSAVFSCVSLISQDIGKLGLRLVENQGGIWSEVVGPSPFQQVLRKPNRYQTRIEFVSQWLSSKLIHGNAYVLKQRDRRGVVVALYVLDPERVRPLVAEDGSVYYELKRNELAELQTEQLVVPAREIIHDKMITLHHPLIGVSPISACGLAAAQGLSIQANSANFFANGSRPSGILSAPGQISNDTATRLKEYWEANFKGDKSGKVAVVGDGLKYEAMVMNSADAQLIEQLRWTSENVASVFHVPAYKIGVGPLPTYQNAAILNQIYYSDCLQALIEAMELSLDEGLELPRGYGTEFDLDDLMRMDQSLMYEANTKAVGGGWMAPDEARRRANLPPVDGGATPYLQQQNYSLSALAKRDSEDPFAAPTAAPPASPDAPASADPASQAADQLRHALRNEKMQPEVAGALAAVVREHIRDTVDPLLKRIADLERQVGELDVPAAVAAAVEALPAPRDGKDGRDADPEVIRSMVDEAVARIPAPRDGADGKDADPEEIRAMIERAVESRPTIDEHISLADVDVLPAIDESKEYPLGTWAIHAGGLWRSHSKTSGLRGWEVVVNGVASIDIEQHDERSFAVRAALTDGAEVVREWHMPVVIDRGVYSEGRRYEPGDGVTWAGSYWIAKEETTDKPGTDAWRLSVKKGRDGKDVARNA